MDTTQYCLLSELAILSFSGLTLGLVLPELLTGPDYRIWGPGELTFSTAIFFCSFIMLLYTFCLEAKRKGCSLKAHFLQFYTFCHGSERNICCFIAHLMLLFTFCHEAERKCFSLKLISCYSKQCIRNVFRPLDFFYILLCYSLILKWIHFSLIYLQTVPHNDKVKTGL